MEEDTVERLVKEHRAAEEFYRRALTEKAEALSECRKENGRPSGPRKAHLKRLQEEFEARSNAASDAYIHFTATETRLTAYVTLRGGEFDFLRNIVLTKKGSPHV